MGAVDPYFIISPTEPPILRQLGDVNNIPESKGCDVLVVTPEVRIGIQRKTWVDLVMSLGDGRLAGSIPKMDMGVKILIIEGEVHFGKDGHMVVRGDSRRHQGGFVRLRHTQESLAGVGLSLRYVHGLDVFYTNSLFDTAALVVHIGAYFSKPRHEGIVGRRYYVRSGGGAAGDPSGWGLVSGEERKKTRQLNFLMGAGIGRKTAENLLAKNGGKIPLQWTMTREQLMEVSLIGYTTADSLVKMFD